MCTPFPLQYIYSVFQSILLYYGLEKNIYKHILITLLCYKNNELYEFMSLKRCFLQNMVCEVFIIHLLITKKVFVYIMMYKERVLEHILLMLQYYKYDEADIHYLDLLQDIFSLMLFTSLLLFIIIEL